jgi:hypothetical protein
VAAEMGSCVLWLELAMGIDHLCEIGATGKGCGTRKPAKDSATTWGFIEQAAEAFVKFEAAGIVFDFFRQ